MTKIQQLIDVLHEQRGSIIVIPKSKEDRKLIQKVAHVCEFETIVDSSYGSFGEIRILVNDFGA